MIQHLKTTASTYCALSPRHIGYSMSIRMQRVHCQALQDSPPPLPMDSPPPLPSGSPPPLPPSDKACRLLQTWSFKSMISSHGNELYCIDSTIERNFFKPQAGKCTAAAAIVRLQLWKWQKFLARRKRPHHWSGVAPSSVGVFFVDCLYSTVVISCVKLNLL